MLLRGPVVPALALVLLLASALPPAAQEVQKISDAELELQEGQHLLARGKHKRAAVHFERADRAAGGGYAEALVGAAQAYNALGDGGKAADAARRAIAAQPPRDLLAAAWHQLGQALARRAAPPEQRAEAQAALRRALALGSQDENAARVRLAGLIPEQPDEVVALTRDYLAIDPEGALALRARVLLCAAKPRARAATVPPVVAPPGPPGGAGNRTPPRPITTPRPDYDDRLLAENDGRAVRLTAVVDEDGCTRDLEVEGGTPELSAVIAAAAARWVFHPARVGGRPTAVPVETRLVVRAPDVPFPPGIDRTIPVTEVIK